MDQFAVPYLTYHPFLALDEHLNPDVLIEPMVDDDGQVQEPNSLDLHAATTSLRCGRRYHTNATSPVTCRR
jgi:hypothetical protein